MSDPLFDLLSDDEIIGLCGGLTQPAAQLRKLHSLGLTKAFRSPRGKVRVLRRAYEVWIDPPPPPAPEWVMPPRPEWKDTPLGRWQKERRESKAATEAWIMENTPKLTWRERAHQAKLERQQAAEARRALVRHHTAKRRCSKLQRTPAWADMEVIKAVYAEARRLTKETGNPHHVDHEIPLQGRLVSGLHVHNNLQILTGSENSKKRNRFEVEP